MNKQRIGIWELGAVGHSAVQFFNPQGNHLEILDLRDPSHPDIQQLPANITYTQQGDVVSIEDFLQRNDVIIASPGIDITPYAHFAHKFMSEIDIVWQSIKTPLIGITGTVGKTTVTTLLSYYLEKLGLSVATGGNIGTPMLDLIKKSSSCDYLVLELSSFQLEYAQQCAPHLAIWTNFYANHLDRHHTIEDYFTAKCKILAHQHAHQHALIPLSLAPLLSQQFGNLEAIRSQLSFFSAQMPTESQLRNLPSSAQLFYTHNNVIHRYKNKQSVPLIALDAIAAKTYQENILIMAAALTCLGQPLDILTRQTEPLRFEHRLEYVATHNGITFYNDSKSTIMQATLAAVQALSGSNIILLLGGLSKGVDRGHDMQKLYGKVDTVICFGKEAQKLAEACTEANLKTQQALTLEEAFDAALKIAKNPSAILLSPGGASFDLFTNYAERGKKFKALVNNYCTTQKNKGP